MKRLCLLACVLLVGCGRSPREKALSDAMFRMEQILSVVNNGRYDVDLSTVKVHRWPVTDIGNWEHHAEGLAPGPQVTPHTYEVLAEATARADWRPTGRGGFEPTDERVDCLVGYAYDEDGNTLRSVVYYNGDVTLVALPLVTNESMAESLSKPTPKPVMRVLPEFASDYPEAEVIR